MNSGSLIASPAYFNITLDWFLLDLHLIDVPSYLALCTLPVNHSAMVCHALNFCSISPFPCGLPSLQSTYEWSHVLTQSSFLLSPSLLLGGTHSALVMDLLKPLMQWHSITFRLVMHLYTSLWQRHSMSIKRQFLFLVKIKQNILE